MKAFVVLLQAIWELIRGILGFVLILGVFGGLAAAVVLPRFRTGDEHVMVPAVSGETVTQAESALEECGLELRVSDREYSDKVAVDRVIRTVPYEGKRVKPGRGVDCVISLGSRSVRVPKVTGLPLSSAEDRLRQAGLSVEEVHREASAQPRHRVLEQRPAAGAKIGRNQSILLVASGGTGFGTYRTSNGVTWLFKRLRVTVPRGAPLQRVRVGVNPADGERRTAYDRVHRPGDEVRVNLVVRKGWTVSVTVRGEPVLSETF